MAAFARPRNPIQRTSHLYVANCGPAAGVSLAAVSEIFSEHGQVESVVAADGTGARVIVSFRSADSAEAAKKAFQGQPCAAMHGRVMNLQFAVPLPVLALEEPLHVRSRAEECEIPGLFLLKEFVSEQEEAVLLAAVDARPWQGLSKRRVQHYGYEFMYSIRNVDISQKLGELPDFLLPVLERIGCLVELADVGELCFPLDQLTVNEYSRGVGLSPHIDTHSAFQGAILSLSLAGACVMEFRRYAREQCRDRENGVSVMDRKALFLPRRSLVILSQEARYAWHHYIPHHKADTVDGQMLDRGPKRVSLTFRKVRHGPCVCNFPQLCDSRHADLSRP